MASRRTGHYVRAVSYEQPLAYLLGLEGLALLRGFAGEFDRDFVAARIAEVRRLVADESLAGDGVDVARVDATEGYRVWSRRYDVGHNSAFDFDQPTVTEIIDALPAGTALDAACGTGRYAELLVTRGHRVIGVDGSPDMLAFARARVPKARFQMGRLQQLPVADRSVDLVVCALALTHVGDLVPVLAEFARVLRPGGHVVISDIHPDRVLRGSIPNVRRQDGRPARLVTHRHLVGDYLRAALPVGLELRRCAEPVDDSPPKTDRATTVGPWDLWPWCLADLIPEAANAVNGNEPAVLIWHFQRGR